MDYHLFSHISKNRYLQVRDIRDEFSYNIDEEIKKLEELGLIKRNESSLDISTDEFDYVYITAKGLRIERILNNIEREIIHLKKDLGFE